MSSRQFMLPQGSDALAEQPRLLYVTCAQYSAEWNSTLHTHTCAELFFITGGHGVFQVQGEGFPVAINDMILVNTGVPHTETSQNGSPMEYVVLGVEGLETLTDISGYALLHLTGQDGVAACLHMLVQEARGGQPSWGPVCQRLLEIILLRLLRRGELSLSGAPAGRSGSGGPKASRECDMVRRYIDNHFKENLTLDQLATLVHINKYYLSHTFRREFNCSPISYLISKRIQESCFLLRETDLTLSQIAQILGFSSLSYFSQSFRRLKEMSPMEYRKRHRQGGGGA